MNLKRIRWAGSTARVVKMRIPTTFNRLDLRDDIHSVDISVDGKIILKCVLMA
jgi:hypothetical protein